MRAIRILVAALVLTGAVAATAAAQADAPGATRARASVRPGYSGHGLDMDVSIDSPLYADRFRIRGAVGHGRWVDEFGQNPPVTLDPPVTRLAGAVLVYIPPPEGVRSRLRIYFGGGIAAFLPRGVDIDRQWGVRAVWVMEVVGSRWTAGPEFEVDLPIWAVPKPPGARSSVPAVRMLAPDGRIGFAIRRNF